MNAKPLIVVAGGNGQLGQLIVTHLLKRHAAVMVLVRSSSATEASTILADRPVEIREVDYRNPLSLVAACLDADCIVSALSGLREVIIEAQTQLLNAAIEARVKRFIPSDFCIDYRPLKRGENRNLDLRREFSKILDASNIKPTSILNGMFTDLLAGQAPVVLHKQSRIFFWGNPDQKMDFTSMKNTAEFTAMAALDNSAPRWLLIAGEEASMRDIQKIATRVNGKQFKFLRPGGLTLFKGVIKLTKLFAPGKNETFPVWQGMQYLYDMLSGVPKFNHLDNDRYTISHWTKIEEIISK